MTKKTRVLLTGSTGMVGRNLLENTALKNYNFLTPNEAELNLFQYEAVDAYLKTNKPDMIIHAAGRVGGIQANIKYPVDFLVQNLDMGRNMIMAARANQIKKLLNFGSSCMYPRNAQNPLKEDQILQGELEPTNEGYALAKITIARLCDYVSREDDSFYYKTIVPCNLYGRYDKFSPENSHLIPAIIRKVYEAVKSGDHDVEIWGDGEARREFMYAGDLADCISQLIGNIKALPSVLNIGLGVDYTINQYYQTVAKVIGYKGTFKHDLNKPVGMARKLVDVSKLTSLGWQYKTSLESGIEKTVQYFIENESRVNK